MYVICKEMWSLYFIIALFVVDLINCQSMYDRRPLVKLSQGILAGIKVYAESGRVADAYLGLPYASPPTGILRFAPPQRHSGWNGTYPASEHRPSCPQLPLSRHNSEDCLYLNVWTPENTQRFGPIPVVIYLEGHEFARSNNFPIPGQDLAMEGVVVVTINYRLNVFGFLCFGIPEARGNMGILDQYFAMLWVRDNIKHFGGDPGKVTLFGHSAGAASVVLHMLSPRTVGLFQRAIISSGSILSPWHMSKDPVTPTKEIARILGCLGLYVKNILSCLRAKSTQDILKSYEEYIDSGNWTGMFLPVVDKFLPENNCYLPNDPETALRDGTYLQVPILTGTSKFISDPQYNQWTEISNQGFAQLKQFMEQSEVPDIIKHYRFNFNNKDQIISLIKWLYITASEGDIRILVKQLKQLDFESKIEAPHFLQLTNLVSSHVQPIYVYYLNDVGFSLNTTDASISSDLLLLFGPLLLHQVGRRRFNSKELRFSKHLKQLWTNFIIFGTPTPNNQLKSWRQYTPTDNYVQYLGTDSKDLSEEIVKRAQRITFWTQILPKLANNRNLYSNRIPKELQTSLDPAAGFRHAMYTLLGLVVALLALLLICIILLKKRSKEREHFHMGF